MVHDKGIAFGTEGPMMQGTWVNPNTGHKFTVRDCFFQDNQFMVQTTDGQLLDYNTIQNYVQCTDNNGREVDFAPQKSQNNIPQHIAEMVEPDAGADGILPEDMEMMKGLGNINAARSAAPQLAPAQPTTPAGNPDRMMIERVLKRHDLPQIESYITWDAPLRQIDTLVNVLGIEPQAIADYYMDYLDANAIMEVIKLQLAGYILDLANGGEVDTTKKPVEPTEPETNPAEDLPVKKEDTETPKPKATKKKSTKK